MRTTKRRVARIVRASVRIIAIQRRARNTDVILARLDTVAHIVVVALDISLAATRYRRTRLAEAADANLSAIAKNTIGTRRVVRFLMIRTVTHAVARIGVIANGFACITARRTRRRIREYTADDCIACVNRALIIVVANQRRTAVADTAAARIVRRTGTSVTARVGVVNPNTSKVCMTFVIGANVSVIAVRWRTANARTA